MDVIYILLLIQLLYIVHIINVNCAVQRGSIKLTDLGNFELPIDPNGGQLKCRGSVVHGSSINSTRESNRANGIKFLLPFMDMEIQHENNLYMVQELQSQQLFVVHGNELYHLNLNRKEKRLSLIGMLMSGGNTSELLGVEILSWHNYLIIVLAFEEQLDIYQISESRIRLRIDATKSAERSNESPPNYQPIQQLTLTAGYRKHFLVAPNADQVLLLVAVRLNKFNAKLRTYEWALSYFDPIEELIIPPITVLNVIGDKQKYLISGRVIRHQPKTIITVYEVVLPEMKLQKHQTLTVSSRNVNSFTFRDRSYLVACSTTSTKCSAFRMSAGGRQFEPYHRRSTQMLSFDHLEAGRNFIVGTRKNEAVVFADARFDCYGSFISNQSDVSTVLAYLNDQSEDYVLLVYRRPFNTLVRMVEIESESGVALSSIWSNATETDDTDGSTPTQQHEFETTIARLRSLLLKRTSAMDIFRRASQTLTPSRITSRTPVHINGGNIGLIKVVGNNRHSPLQILERIEEMRALFGSSRSRRSVAIGSESKLRNHLKIRRLHVNNVLYNGSLLSGFHLDSQALPWPILFVRENIVTDSLKTEILVTRNEESRWRRQLVEDSTTNIIRDLRVERINGILWKDIYNELFLKTRDTKIKGNLILKSRATIAHLHTTTFNTMPVDKLFNLKKTQRIYSTMHIANMVTTELQANQINGLSFADDVVFRGIPDVLITSPVIMNRARVIGDLLIDRPSRSERTEANEQQFLQQIYMGKVIINGSLTITNLALRDKDTKVLVDGKILSEKVLNESYLLNKTAQSFKQSIVFENAKLTVPKLRTNYLNDHNTTNHLIDVSNEIQQDQEEFLPMLVFLSAQVHGDVIFSTNETTKMRELDSDVVRYGDIANITGFKHFEAPLVVDQLMTLSVNQVPTDDLVMRSQLRNKITFSDTKTFDSILVNDAVFVENELNVTCLNDFQLNDLLSQEYYFDNVSLPRNLTLQKIYVKNLNDNGFYEAQQILERSPTNTDKLRLKKEIVIDGSLKIVENIQLTQINNVDWRTYRESLVNINEDTVIEGKKRFFGDLTVKEAVNVQQVNDFNMTDIFANVMRSSKPQYITGSFTFGRLHLGNVDVDEINDIHTNNFVNTRSPSVTIKSDLYVTKLVVHGDINCNFADPFNLPAIVEGVSKLPQREWRNVVVLRNASWSAPTTIITEQEQLLKYLYTNAIRKDGIQEITGNVGMYEPFIHRMNTMETFKPFQDLMLLRNDALLRNSDKPQIMQGVYHFHKPIHMMNDVIAGSKSNLNIFQVNGIDIKRFNESLYRLSSRQIIRGTLSSTRNLKIHNLNVSGCVNGVSISDIYQLQDGEMPPAHIMDLVIENELLVNMINDIDLESMLRNRITKTGSTALEINGTLAIRRLVLKKDSMLKSINGIALNNVVFKQSHDQTPQVIGGKTIIEGKLKLDGPTNVKLLNGQDLTDLYQHSILSSGDYQFDELIIDDVTFENGLVLSNPSMVVSGPRVETEDDHVSQSSLNDVENSSLHQKQSHQDIVYLDYDYETSIIWDQSNKNISQNLYYSTATYNSSCERKIYEIQLVPSSKKIFIRNLTSSHVTASRNNFTVKAENYCLDNQEKIKSRIQLSGPHNLTRAFVMKKCIDSLNIYPIDQSNVTLILLHARDPNLSERHEVRILRIDSKNGGEIRDWQSINETVGRTMRLLRLPGTGREILATSGLHKYYPAMRLYTLDEEAQEFKPQQTIAGNFDIIGVSKISFEKNHLILGCHHCQRISIYEWIQNTTALKNYSSIENTGKYHIFQIIRLTDILIEDIIPFTVSESDFYLLVLPEVNQGRYYYIYKFANILGWTLSLRGYIHNNIQSVIPIISFDRTKKNNSDTSLRTDDPLFRLLLCGMEQKCVLIKALLRY